jgi:hypothetical protein
MLVEHWDDLDGYSEAVLEEFDWMRKERIALDRVAGGNLPTTGDLRTFVQHARRAGFGMGPINALRFFKKALQSDRGEVGEVALPMERVTR